MRKTIDIAKLIFSVCNEMSLSPESVMGKRKSKEAKKALAVMVYILRKSKYNDRDISEVLGIHQRVVNNYGRAANDMLNGGDNTIAAIWVKYYKYLLK